MECPAFNCSRFSIISYSCKKWEKLLFRSHRQTYRKFNYRKYFTRAPGHQKPTFIFFPTCKCPGFTRAFFRLIIFYNSVGDCRCSMFSSKNASGSPVIKHYCILSDHVRCTGDKNEKDDFGDDDKRNPTKLCLASASLHQHRSPAAALLWLWRKQQIRDKGKTEMGHVV